MQVFTGGKIRQSHIPAYIPVTIDTVRETQFSIVEPVGFKKWFVSENSASCYRGERSSFIIGAKSGVAVAAHGKRKHVTVLESVEQARH